MPRSPFILRLRLKFAPSVFELKKLCAPVSCYSPIEINVCTLLRHGRRGRHGSGAANLTVQDSRQSNCAAATGVDALTAPRLFAALGGKILGSGGSVRGRQKGVAAAKRIQRLLLEEAPPPLGRSSAIPSPRSLPFPRLPRFLVSKLFRLLLLPPRRTEPPESTRVGWQKLGMRLSSAPCRRA